MSRWVGTLIACSAVLAACGPQPAPLSADRGLGIAAATPPSSGLEAYQRSGGSGSHDDWSKPGGDWSKPGGDWNKPGGDWSKPGGNGNKPGGDWSKPGGNWNQPGGNWGGGNWGNDFGYGYGGGSPWGVGGGYGNPWGWPYYLPPVYVSSSVGNPFAPPPLAAGPWISPFFGYLGYFGI